MQATLHATLLGLLALAAATPALAQDATTRVQIVQSRDLDLATGAGQATLRHRIRSAAINVCGPAVTFSQPGYEDFRACMLNAQQTANRRADLLISQATAASRSYAAR